MKTHRRNRLLLVAGVVAASGLAVGLALMALNENVNLFYTPDQIVSGEAPVGPTIRAGGMVVDGSVNRSETDLTVSFMVSNLSDAEVEIQYTGILPDLFREGQGIVARGVLRDDGVFVAQEVLAKHDENYMPPEVAKALEEAHGGKVPAYSQGYGDGYGDAGT